MKTLNTNQTNLKFYLEFAFMESDSGEARKEKLAPHPFGLHLQPIPLIPWFLMGIHFGIC